MPGGTGQPRPGVPGQASQMSGLMGSLMGGQGGGGPGGGMAGLFGGGPGAAPGGPNPGQGGMMGSMFGGSQDQQTAQMGMPPVSATQQRFDAESPFGAIEAALDQRKLNQTLPEDQQESAMRKLFAGKGGMFG